MCVCVCAFVLWCCCVCCAGISAYQMPTQAEIASALDSRGRGMVRNALLEALPACRACLPACLPVCLCVSVPSQSWQIDSIVFCLQGDWGELSSYGQVSGYVETTETVRTFICFNIYYTHVYSENRTSRRSSRKQEKTNACILMFNI